MSLNVGSTTTVAATGTLRLDGGTLSTKSFTHTLGGTLDFDEGVLEIDGGAFDNGVSLFSFQGSAAGQTATFRLTNESTGASAELRVGNTGPFGSGRFELLDGSAFSSTVGRIATQANSSGSALVDADSVWTTGALRVGEGGVGSLTVQNGGDVNVTNTNQTSVHVGRNAGATGTLLVTGSGSTLTTATGGDMAIGLVGAGTVTVANSGLIDIVNLTTIGATGRLNLQGGTLSTRSFTHTAGGTLDFDEGVLEIDGGAFNNGVTDFAFQGATAGQTATFRLTNESTGASAELRVGNTGPFGSGRFELLDGSAFSSTVGRIATQANSSGSALVDADSVWTTGALRVGEGGVGSLTVQNGGDVNVTNTNQTSVHVGRNAGATGTLLVTGSGSTLTTATGGDMAIGLVGAGTVTVANSGLIDIVNLTTIGATGRLNLQGGTLSTRSFTHTAGGTLDFDEGVLEIDGGAFNNGVTDFAFQGATAGQTATFRLTNESTGASAELRVGNTGPFGSGRFELLDGSAFSSTVGRIATQANSSGSALVDADSVWTTGALRVGEGGVGSLTVQNGGDVNVTNTNQTSVHVGRNAGATGTLLVTGSGSTLTTATGGDMAIGLVGAGTVTVANSGLIDIAALTTIGAVGRLNLQGGTFRTGSLTRIAGSTFDFVSGTLHVDNFVGDLTNQGGTLAPGQSPGVTTITGDYTQLAAATLQLEIGGLTPGSQYDQVNSAGSVQLDGALDVQLIGGFVPAAWDRFEVLHAAAGVFGEFDDTLPLPALSPGLAWNVDYADFKVVLEALPVLAADFDEDRDVDGDDLARWTLNFGTGSSHLQGDANDDDVVDGADFLVWQSQLGSTSPLLASSTPIPEPAGFIQVVIGLAVLGGWLRLAFPPTRAAIAANG